MDEMDTQQIIENKMKKQKQKKQIVNEDSSKDAVKTITDSKKNIEQG